MITAYQCCSCPKVLYKRQRCECGSTVLRTVTVPSPPEFRCYGCGALRRTPVYVDGPVPGWSRIKWACGHAATILCGSCDFEQEVLACPTCGRMEHTR